MAGLVVGPADGVNAAVDKVDKVDPADKVAPVAAVVKGHSGHSVRNKRRPGARRSIGRYAHVTYAHRPPRPPGRSTRPR